VVRASRSCCFAAGRSGHGYAYRRGHLGRHNGGVLRIPVVRLAADLPLPAYARAGDAGADLVAAEGAVLAAGGGRALIPTGIALAIPEGYAGFVQPRSGLALRHGVTCLNTPGLIDAGYRDELRVLLVNTDPEADYEVRRGDRIAQLVLQRVERAEFAPVPALDTSERGTGGFGHTGT
jgi:dUTP pyrophosphatase